MFNKKTSQSISVTILNITLTKTEEKKTKNKGIDKKTLPQFLF